MTNDRPLTAEEYAEAEFARGYTKGFERGKLQGREEADNKECEYNLDGCHSCSKVKDKIASLEKQVAEKNATIDELIKPTNKFVKENTKLREEIDRIKSGDFNGAKVIKEELKAFGIVKAERDRLRQALEKIVVLKAKTGGASAYDMREIAKKALEGK